MPFDSLDAPPEWRPKPAAEPEPPLSRRDLLVAAALASVLGTITLANCHALLSYCHVR